MTEGEKQVGEVVKEIEATFQCKIMGPETKVNGFAKNEQISQLHCWTGHIDAVGLMNKNNRVIVIDWKTCDDVKGFWDKAEQYKAKLHQNILYRRLLAMQMRHYFKDNEIPEPGIMIVAIDRDNVGVYDARLCLDFKKLEEAGIFAEIDSKELIWTAGEPIKVRMDSTFSWETRRLL